MTSVARRPERGFEPSAHGDIPDHGRCAINAPNWARSRLRLGVCATRCAEDGHAWLAPDPVTGRRHCRRCVAFLPGLPDELMARLGAGDAAGALGWDATTGMTFRGEPNPAWAGVVERRAARAAAPGTDNAVGDVVG